MATNDTRPLTGQTLAIIGCGTMATAILTGLLSSSCAPPASSSTTSTSASTPTSTPTFTTTFNPSPTSPTPGSAPLISRFIATVNSAASAEKLRSQFGDKLDVRCGAEDVECNVKAMRDADVVLLAFKPYMVEQVLSKANVHGALKDKLIISVLVGSPIDKLKAAILMRTGVSPTDFGRNYQNYLQQSYTLHIKRAMMNIAAAHNTSMTVIEDAPDPRFPAAFTTFTQTLFSQIGSTLSVTPSTYDISGVLAGASGALLTIALDGMLDGAVASGLKRTDAKTVLAGALTSLASLLKEGEHPAVLREKFSSPKGTTIEGLMALEEEGARWAYCKAVRRAGERSLEIGKGT